MKVAKRKVAKATVAKNKVANATVVPVKVKKKIIKKNFADYRK